MAPKATSPKKATSPTKGTSPTKVSKPTRRSPRIQAKTSPTYLNHHFQDALAVGFSDSATQETKPPLKGAGSVPRTDGTAPYRPPYLTGLSNRWAPLERAVSNRRYSPQGISRSATYNVPSSHHLVHPKDNEKLLAFNGHARSLNSSFCVGDIITVAISRNSSTPFAKKKDLDSLVPSPIFAEKKLWIHTKLRPAIVIAKYPSHMLVIPTNTSSGRGLKRWEGQPEYNHCVALAHDGEDYQPGYFKGSLQTIGKPSKVPDSYIRITDVVTIDYDDPTTRSTDRRLEPKSTIWLLKQWLDDTQERVLAELAKQQNLAENEDIVRETEDKVGELREAAQEEIAKNQLRYSDREQGGRGDEDDRMGYNGGYA